MVTPGFPKDLLLNLSQYSPGKNCKDKYVVLDQGGELYNNLEVHNLFTSKGYKIMLTGADASDLSGALTRLSLTVLEPSLLAQTLLYNFGCTLSTMLWGSPTHSLKQARINPPFNWRTPMENQKISPRSKILPAELG